MGWARWKPWILLAGAAAGLLIGAGLWAEWHIRSVWSRMEFQVDALLAEVRAHDGRRPVPLAEPVPGNAWDEYDQAFETIDRDMIRARVLRFFLPDPIAHVAFLETDIPTLQHLRAGARRETWRYVRPRESPEDVDLRRSVSHALGLALSDVVHQSKRGRLPEAIERMIALQQVLRDLEGAPSRVYESPALYYGDELWKQWKEVLARPGFPGTDLVTFETALRTLEEGMPSISDLLKIRILEEGFRAQRHERRLHAHGPTDLPTGARLLWSERLTLADAFLRFAATFRDAGRHADLPWPALRERLRERERTDLLGPNPYYVQFPAHPEWEVGTLLKRRTRIQLVRAALLLRATGRMPDLPDPFGDRLLHRREDSLDRIWSRGLNAADDDASGDDLRILLHR